MITYIYECKKCGVVLEIDQSIKDDAFTFCPECETESLERVPQVPLYCHVVGEPTTIGQLADRNTKHMSSEQMSKLQEQYKTKKTINRFPEGTIKSAEEPSKEDLPSWVQKPRTKSYKELNNMTTKQVEKYIKTGE